MKLRRREFLAGSIAAGWSAQGAARPGAAAFAPRIVRFDTAGGAVRNGGAQNREAFSRAVDALSKSGGGTLIVPAGTYPFSGNAAMTASNVAVDARGATFTGPDCRITILPGSIRVAIHGLRIVDTSGSSAAYLLDCAGSDCRFKDVHLEKIPAAGGYIGYCQQDTSGNVFENFSFSGSNGMFMGGRNHEIRGGWAKADAGGDDCWVLKSTIRPCENIRISGFRARGFAALISIGSEIGRHADVRTAHPLYVRNVAIQDCAAEGCTYFAYIKPGGVAPGSIAANYQNGLVEDVRINDCRCEDAVGAAFRNAIYVAPGRGATVRRLTVERLSVRARAQSPAVQTTGAIYLRVLHMTNDAGEGGAIEDVVVNGLRCIDPHGGAPEGSGVPGLPIYTPIAIEKEEAAIGRIGRVEVRNAFADGCARSAVSVGPGVDGPVRILDSEFRNFSAAPLAALDRHPIIAQSPVDVQNVVSSPSPLAPPQ